MHRHNKLGCRIHRFIQYVREIREFLVTLVNRHVGDVGNRLYLSHQQQSSSWFVKAALGEHLAYQKRLMKCPEHPHREVVAVVNLIRLAQH